VDCADKSGRRPPIHDQPVIIAPSIPRNTSRNQPQQISACRFG
jgi:hypothetical protein